MKTLSEPGAAEVLIARLGKLHEKRPRAWGQMTPHEMICHLNDSFEGVLGDRPIAPIDTVLSRTVIKYIALHTKFAWPKGVKTTPEVDQKRGGTRPADFDQDRAKTIGLIQRFIAPGARYESHPAMGPLTRDEWMIWAWRHTDHHLRQFAL